MRTITTVVMLSIIIFSFLLFAHGQNVRGASGYQIWRVPNNVERVMFTYKAPNGRVVHQQSIDVSPNHTIEVMILK